MEIFIRIHSEDGTVAWWHHDDGESYLVDGEDLWAEGQYEDYLRGTAFKSVKQAKHEAKEAVMLAGWDGVLNPKATFWQIIGGKPVQVKITREGRITRA